MIDMVVIKRDGRKVDFQGDKISNAIQKAMLTETGKRGEKGTLSLNVYAAGYGTDWITSAISLFLQDNAGVKYYLDENRGYCVPKRSMDEVLLKTL